MSRGPCAGLSPATCRQDSPLPSPLARMQHDQLLPLPPPSLSPAGFKEASGASPPRNTERRRGRNWYSVQNVHLFLQGLYDHSFRAPCTEPPGRPDAHGRSHFKCCKRKGEAVLGTEAGLRFCPLRHSLTGERERRSKGGGLAEAVGGACPGGFSQAGSQAEREVPDGESRTRTWLAETECSSQAVRFHGLSGQSRLPREYHVTEDTKGLDYSRTPTCPGVHFLNLFCSSIGI